MTRTINQNSILHAVLGKLGWMERKAELVYTFSNKRTESSSELTEFECKELINWLNKQTKPKPAPKPQSKKRADDPADKMRKKILSICHNLSWEVPGGAIDWEHLNNWLDQYGYLHKPLNSYSEQELPRLVTQFEAIERTTLYKTK